MASGVEELLDMLFEMIDEAKNVPLSGDKCMIERDRALDLIDDIRSQFPVELSEARKMMANRAELSPPQNARPTPSARRRRIRRASCWRRMSHPPGKQKANDLKRETEERSRDLKRSATSTAKMCCVVRRRQWLPPMMRSRSLGPASRAAAGASAVPQAGSTGSRPIYDAAADED